MVVGFLAVFFIEKRQLYQLTYTCTWSKGYDVFVYWRSKVSSWKNL